jgi:hypothetical protein
MVPKTGKRDEVLQEIYLGATIREIRSKVGKAGIPTWKILKLSSTQCTLNTPLLPCYRYDCEPL